MALYHASVDLDQFIAIAKHARFNQKMGKRNIAREVVEIRYIAKKLKITIAGVEYATPATGHWRGIAVIPLASFRVVGKVPPITNPVEIVFDTKERYLKIASTRFSLE